MQRLSEQNKKPYQNISEKFYYLPFDPNSKKNLDLQR